MADFQNVSCFVFEQNTTYLIIHNNLINGFWPAATHPSRRIYFLRAYASWSHQLITGLPRFGPSKGYKAVLCANFRKSPHQIFVSPDYLPLFARHCPSSRLTDFGLPQHILPGASASCAPTPVGHTNRWQGFLDLVLPTDTRSTSSPSSADPLIKYPSRRIIFLYSHVMAEPAQSLREANTLHNVYVSKELIQLTVGSNAEIIANSQWTEDFT